MVNFKHSCAALNGIHPAVVSRAEDLILMMARGEDLVAACEILSVGERKELEEAVISHTPSSLPQVFSNNSHDAQEAVARAFVQEDFDDDDDDDEDENEESNSGTSEARETARMKLERILQGVSTSEGYMSSS